MLHRYEKRTGNVVGLAELESGELRSKLTKDDYNIKDMVSPSFLTFLTLKLEVLVKITLLEAVLTVLLILLPDRVICTDFPVDRGVFTHYTT